VNISGLLGTFASSLRFYIDEFGRIILHVSGNLPLVGNQIDCHITEARKLLDNCPDVTGEYYELLDDMSAVRIPIFEIIIELQKEDIINQQMNHLLEAVEDVQKVIDENQVLFVDYAEKIVRIENREEYRHIFTLISFLLNSIEKQMTRINAELLDLVQVMEDQCRGMKLKIDKIQSERHILEGNTDELNKSFQSILNITKNLSSELEQYNNFFERLRLLQDDMNREVSICSSLRKEVDEDQSRFGGELPLSQCRFNSSIIKKIVSKLTVEGERQTLRDEFSDLKIEESSGSNLILF